MVTGALRSNFIHYYLDIAWWGLYAGTILPFLSVYAVRNGATNEQIGILNAAPAAIALLLSLPVGQWVRRFSAKRATIISLFFQRIVMISFPLLPVLLPPEAQVNGILVVTVAIGIPAAVSGISFNQLFMEAIPSEHRARVVGTRIALFSILTFFVTLFSGFILNSVAGAAGYQIIFAVGFVGAIMTVYHLSRIQPLDVEQVVVDEVVDAPGSSRWLPRMDTVGRRYLKVLGLLFVFNTVNNLVVPLLPPFAVNKLHLSDQVIGIGAATNTFFVFLVSLAVARITRKIGNQRATGWGIMILVTAAFVMAAAQDAVLYLAAMVVGGISSGVLATSQFNYVLDYIPPKARTGWLAVNLLTGNAAILIGSLLGPVLVTQLAFPDTLRLVGVVRLLVGLAILKWG